MYQTEHIDLHRYYIITNIIGVPENNTKRTILLKYIKI